MPFPLFAECVMLLICFFERGPPILYLSSDTRHNQAVVWQICSCFNFAPSPEDFSEHTGSHLAPAMRSVASILPIYSATAPFSMVIQEIRRLYSPSDVCFELQRCRRSISADSGCLSNSVKISWRLPLVHLLHGMPCCDCLSITNVSLPSWS